MRMVKLTSAPEKEGAAQMVRLMMACRPIHPPLDDRDEKERSQHRQQRFEARVVARYAFCKQNHQGSKSAALLQQLSTCGVSLLWVYTLEPLLCIKAPLAIPLRQAISGSLLRHRLILVGDDEWTIWQLSVE